MRKFSLLLLSTIMSVCLISSCSDDDDDDNKVNNSIVGTWKFDKVVSTDVKTNSGENDTKVKTYISEGITDDLTGTIWTFKEDGTMIEKYDSEDKNGKYTFSNGKLTIIFAVDDSHSFNASVDNGVLYIDADYKEDLNEMELDQLVRLVGIGDMDFKADKATVKVNFNRN